MSVPEPELTTRQVFSEHASFVLRVVRRLGTRPGDVDDVAQDVFVVVQRKLHTYDHTSSVRTWLYGIARRVVSDYRRKHEARREVSDVGFDRATDPRQEEDLQRRRMLAALDRALDELSDAKREVFVLYELEGLPMQEIAEMVGCPLFTAYSRLREARQSMATSLSRASTPEERRP